MKKVFRRIALLTIPILLAAAFGIYVSQIPSVYHCRAGEEPADNVFYTLEANENARSDSDTIALRYT